MELFIWPITIFIIVIIVLVLFYKPLYKFFDKMTSLKLPGGIESTSAQGQANLVKPDKVYEEILKLFDNKLVIQQEEKIRKFISFDDIQSTDDKIKILLKYSSSLAIETIFEVAYANIFGTQIALLENINPKEDGELKSNLKVYFDSHMQMLPPPGGNTFDNYLEFLTYYNLIKFSGERVLITLAGREFLSYIVHTAKSKDKYL